MLVISRNDGDCILFHVDRVSVVLTCRCSEDGLKLYQGKRLLVVLSERGEWANIVVRKQLVTITLVKRRGYDAFSIGLDADRSVIIHRDDFTGD